MLASVFLSKESSQATTSMTLAARQEQAPVQGLSRRKGAVRTGLRKRGVRTGDRVPPPAGEGPRRARLFLWWGLESVNEHQANCDEFALCWFVVCLHAEKRETIILKEGRNDIDDNAKA